MIFDAYKDLRELFELKQYDHVVSSCISRLEIDQNDSKLWYLMGFALFRLQNYEVSKICLNQAIEKDSNFFEAYNLLGHIFSLENDYPNALSMWLKTYNYLAHDVILVGNVATAYLNMQDFENAYIWANKALQISDQYVDAYRCLQKIAQAKQNIPQVEYFLRKILALDPQDIMANFDLSYVLFMRQDYDSAFYHYEFRKQLPKRTHEYGYLPFAENNICAKSLLIYHEQGFGDNIMFSRFLNELKNPYIAFGVQNSLHRLFAFNFKNISMFSEIDARMPFDGCVPLMSIPYNLKISQVASGAYLNVDNIDIEQFNLKLSTKSFKIGIVWKGSVQNDTDQKRLIELDDLQQLFKIAGVEFFSFQIDRCEGIEKFPIVNLGPSFSDFYDTAVALKTMDLMLVVDTAVAHLSGSLGIDTLLLQNDTVFDWRWMHHEQQSLWYESVTVFEYGINKTLCNVVNDIELLILNKKS